MIEKHTDTDEERRNRYRQAAALLRTWIEEDAVEDDASWSLLEGELKQSDIKFGDPDVSPS
jgi:hypothetical protein